MDRDSIFSEQLKLMYRRMYRYLYHHLSSKRCGTIFNMIFKVQRRTRHVLINLFFVISLIDQHAIFQNVAKAFESTQNSNDFFFMLNKLNAFSAQSVDGP